MGAGKSHPRRLNGVRQGEKPAIIARRPEVTSQAPGRYARTV